MVSPSPHSSRCCPGTAARLYIMACTNPRPHNALRKPLHLGQADALHFNFPMLPHLPCAFRLHLRPHYHSTSRHPARTVWLFGHNIPKHSQRRAGGPKPASHVCLCIFSPPPPSPIISKHQRYHLASVRIICADRTLQAAARSPYIPAPHFFRSCCLSRQNLLH